MSIEKLNALNSSTQSLQQTPAQQIENKEEKVHDKKLSESSKIHDWQQQRLPVPLQLAIIGHKQGWWGKAEKAAAQLTSNETPHKADPANSDFDILKMVHENGYALLCQKTGKAFNKIYDEQNKSFRYIYSRTLENGSQIEINKQNILTSNTHGEQIHTRITEYSLKNKDGKLIYKTSIEKGSNFRPETIYDYETMTAYEVRAVNCSILGGAPIPTKQAVKMPFEEVDGKIKLKNETPLELNELEQVRRKIFDNNLPASYDRLKIKIP